MELNTKRLIIREAAWDDLDDIFFLESSPEVDEFNTLGIPDNKKITRDHLRPYIQDQKAEVRKKYCWSICIQTTNVSIPATAYLEYGNIAN